MAEVKDVSAKTSLQSSPVMGTIPLLELKRVSKTYGHMKALSDVSFSLEKGEIVALLGDNGAGKSTLVKLISGLEVPTEGSIVWNGTEVQFNGRSDAEECGIETIFQDTALVDTMSIYRNIFVGRELVSRFGNLRHQEMRRIASEVLRSVVEIEGIDSPCKLVGSLSGGQKQAVAIARAIYFNRVLLVLDEPTSALAVRATQALFEYLQSLKAKGVTSLLVTHNLFDAYRLCDRFVVMSRGRVVFNEQRDGTSIDELIEKVSTG